MDRYAKSFVAFGSMDANISMALHVIKATESDD